MKTIPETNRFGGPEVLTRLPVPDLDDDEVLIKLDTAGVGIWDAEMRRGVFMEEAQFPLVLGTDGAGTRDGRGI